MKIGERILELLKERGLSQNRLAKQAQISQSGLSDIINGISNPKEFTLRSIADALGVSVSELLGETGFIPMIKSAVPILGEIACGVPITAEQNIAGYADLPDGIRADFALKCKGESMIPTFNENDLVLIRQQPDVEDGQIAAVNINGETTLKRVYHQNNGLLLVADNPRFGPIFADGSQEIIIHGLAVGYTRMLQR